MRVGGNVEESFTTDLEWSPTDLMHRVRWNRSDYDVVEISEKDAKRFETTQARRTEDIRERHGG